MHDKEEKIVTAAAADIFTPKSRSNMENRNRPVSHPPCKSDEDMVHIG